MENISLKQTFFYHFDIVNTSHFERNRVFTPHVLSGDIPNTMTLTKFYSDFTEDWEEQEHHFGMTKEEKIV